jgi:hypothetical protein
MQTSTDVTEHPDFLEASGTRLKVLKCGEVQYHPFVSGSIPKTVCFGLGLAGCLGLLKKPSVTLKHSEKPLFLNIDNR